jgi:hypothetical protein
MSPLVVTLFLTNEIFQWERFFKSSALTPPPMQ